MLGCRHVSTFSFIDGWNHNSHYHDLLLAAVPRPCPRALDVGCGLGSFARLLGRRVEHVDAIDIDPDVVAKARERSAGMSNLRFIIADFETWTPADAYDYISMIATLHHLPFAGTLRKVDSLLRPGGVLAVLGLDRARSWLQSAARSAVACPVSGWYRLTRRTETVGAAIREPGMTLDEIAAQASSILPGAVIRRHLLWRYSMVWVRPSERA
jgi:trans-aconitate methyltransferase